MKPTFSNKQTDFLCSDGGANSKSSPQIKAQPGLTALNVDTKKPLALTKNNTNLTERTAGSSSHLKEEYSRLHNDGASHTKKGIEMYNVKELQKQIGRAATPFIQEIYKQQVDAGKIKPGPVGPVIKTRKSNKNQSIVAQISMSKKLAHLRSKSHSNMIHLIDRKLG